MTNVDAHTPDENRTLVNCWDPFLKVHKKVVAKSITFRHSKATEVDEDEVIVHDLVINDPQFDHEGFVSGVQVDHVTDITADFAGVYGYIEWREEILGEELVNSEGKLAEVPEDE